MGDTLEWCHYADHQWDSARGSSPGRPRATAVSPGQAKTEVDGLLPEPRPQRSPYVPPLRRQPADLLPLATPLPWLSSLQQCWLHSPQAPGASGGAGEGRRLWRFSSFLASPRSRHVGWWATSRPDRRLWTARLGAASNGCGGGCRLGLIEKGEENLRLLVAWQSG